MTYRGFDVLEERHNARDQIAQAFGRLGTMLENPTGRRTWDDHGGIAIPTRSFTWTAVDRAGVLELRAFLEARRGRRIPFWTPTFLWDLQLAQDAVGDETTITIAGSGYTEFRFASPARRDLAIYPPGAEPLLRRVTETEVEGETEILYLDAIPGVPLPAAYSRICLLTLCRLAEDLTSIRYSSPELAEAEIRFVELPREVPA